MAEVEPAAHNWIEAMSKARLYSANCVFQAILLESFHIVSLQRPTGWTCFLLDPMPMNLGKMTVKVFSRYLCIFLT